MAIGPDGSKLTPQTRQLHRPGGSEISSRAPSRLVPSVTRSKQNRTESATTPDRAPISSRTQVIRASGRRPVTASTTPSVMASSCTAIALSQFAGRVFAGRGLAGRLSAGRIWVGGLDESADPRQRVADQQVDDPGAAERGLELD